MEKYIMKKLKYDLIFSLGEACSCTQALRSCELQCASYPLDWLFGNDFNGRIEILASNFSRFVEKDDLRALDYNNGDTKNLCNVYQNDYTGLILNHDFPAGIPLEESYPEVFNKYQRRINRLLTNIQNADSILLVYIETPNNENHTSDKNISAGWKQIQQKHPNKKIDLLYIMCDITLSPRDIKKENISSNITKVIANYKSKSPEALPYVVDNCILKTILNKYKLKIPLKQKIQKSIKKIVIKLIPIKSVRKKLRKIYHV